MITLLCFFLTLFASPFKSKSRLEAENAALRHQLTVRQRRVLPLGLNAAANTWSSCPGGVAIRCRIRAVQLWAG